MARFQVAFQRDTRVATVQAEGAQLPDGTEKIGQFEFLPENSDRTFNAVAEDKVYGFLTDAKVGKVRNIDLRVEQSAYDAVNPQQVEKHEDEVETLPVHETGDLDTTTQVPGDGYQGEDVTQEEKQEEEDQEESEEDRELRELEEEEARKNQE